MGILHFIRRNNTYFLPLQIYPIKVNVSRFRKRIRDVYICFKIRDIHR